MAAKAYGADGGTSVHPFRHSAERPDRNYNQSEGGDAPSGFHRRISNMPVNVTKKDSGTTVVGYEGRLDSATAGELQDVLDAEITDSLQALVIDMASTDYVSSKGLRVLVAARKRMGARSMTIVNANKSVLDIMRLSGLLKVFSIEG